MKKLYLSNSFSLFILLIFFIPIAEASDNLKVTLKNSLPNAMNFQLTSTEMVLDGVNSTCNTGSGGSLDSGSSCYFKAQCKESSDIIDIHVKDNAGNDNDSRMTCAGDFIGTAVTGSLCFVFAKNSGGDFTLNYQSDGCSTKNQRVKPK